MVIERADYHSRISAEFSCTPTSAHLNFTHDQGECGKWIVLLFLKEKTVSQTKLSVYCVYEAILYWLNGGICSNLYQRTNIKHFRHLGIGEDNTCIKPQRYMVSHTGEFQRTQCQKK